MTNTRMFLRLATVKQTGTVATARRIIAERLAAAASAAVARIA